MKPSDKPPKFKEPPVVELALGVQFERLERLKAVHYGLWWQAIREQFPKVEEHAPLGPIMEPFDLTQPVEVNVQISDSPPPMRWWFLTKEATRLIQIQEDRFVYNWRKRAASNEPYPSYDDLIEDFMGYLKSFCAFLAEGKHGLFNPNMCEITYVNHVVAGNEWKDHSEMHKVTTLVAPRYSDGYLPPMEGIGFNTTYLMKQDTRALGRLKVNVAPAFRGKDKLPVTVLNVSAFALPSSKDVDGVRAALDRAHEWTVRGFASVTPTEMHKVWGRTQ